MPVSLTSKEKAKRDNLMDFSKIQKPSMQLWSETWHNKDSLAFKNTYAKDALIFPPNKEAVQGNTSILNFMSGGMGKVDVLFEPKELIVGEGLAFESGIFKDIEFSGDTILASGKYSVTWILGETSWKILCHTWSMPAKEK